MGGYGGFGGYGGYGGFGGYGMGYPYGGYGGYGGYGTGYGYPVTGYGFVGASQNLNTNLVGSQIPSSQQFFET